MIDVARAGILAGMVIGIPSVVLAAFGWAGLTFAVPFWFVLVILLGSE